MESPGKTTESGSEQVGGQPAKFQVGNILGLPNELLSRVIAFLSMGSIRNFMVNRPLRPICEQGLYQSISLPSHPRRSLRLLETFLLRPDLALLVRHLEINFSELDPRPSPQSQVPSAIQLDGLAALSLAKNLQSFSLEGIADWIWNPERAKLREIVFEMGLVRLAVHTLRDPHTMYACKWPGDSDSEDDQWKGDLGDEIRRLLQKQPLLEELDLRQTSITYKTAASLQTNLRASDVPSLKYIHADPEVALAFLPVAPQLDSLNLTISHWSDQLLSKIETSSAAIRLSIRRFTIRVWFSSYDRWFWNDVNMANVFALFPNTEELSVTINSLTTGSDVEPAKYYFSKIANNVGVLPSLQNVVVRFESLSRDTPEIFEVEAQSVVDFKASCPHLETVVDPKGRCWTFRTDQKSSRGFVPNLVGQLRDEHLEWIEDLPAPAGDSLS